MAWLRAKLCVAHEPTFNIPRKGRILNIGFFRMHAKVVREKEPGVGYYWDSQKLWNCAPAIMTKYQKRISGPLLDRIDIHIEVPRRHQVIQRLMRTFKVVKQR
jgi:hypothetical protein